MPSYKSAAGTTGSRRPVDRFLRRSLLQATSCGTGEEPGKISQRPKCFRYIVVYYKNNELWACVRWPAGQLQD